MGKVDLLHAEEDVEDPVGGVELHPAGVRQHAAHLGLEVVPLVVFEVVEDRETALEQIFAEAGALLVGHDPEPGLPHIENGVVEDLGVVQPKDAALRIHVNQG